MPPEKRKKGKFAKRLKKIQLNKVDRAVLDTLCYRAVFNYPVSLYQISTFLISKDLVDIRSVKNSLKKLVSKRKVKVHQGMYHLSGVKPVNRKYRVKEAESLIGKAERTARVLGKIPWVKMVAVTGSVAAYNASEKSDIDVLIISQTSRLWLTRAFATLILKILNQYRTDENEGSKICPNIYIDESKTAWHRENRSVHVANDIVMMIPLFDRKSAYFNFLKQNNWVFGYFGNLKEPPYEVEQVKKRSSCAGSILEFLAFRMQLFYMRKRKTTEITTGSLIHFKRFDNSAKIVAGYEGLKSRIVLE